MQSHITIGNLHKHSYSLSAQHIYPIYTFIIRKYNSSSFCCKMCGFTFR